MDTWFPIVSTVVVVLVAIAGYTYVRRLTARHVEQFVATSGPRMRAFFERSGYAFPELRGAGPDAQVARMQQAFQAAAGGGPYEVHLVRDVGGLEVHWEHFQGERNGAFVVGQSWWAPLRSVPRTPFHVVEASLGKDTRPAFPRQIRTGIAAIDGRFAVFGVHDDAVRAVLSNPALQQHLLACAHVDLRVVPDAVRVDDPKQANTLAAMGGTAGAMRFADDPAGAFEVTMPVHDRMAALLRLAVSVAG